MNNNRTVSQRRMTTSCLTRWRSVSTRRRGSRASSTSASWHSPPASASDTQTSTQQTASRGESRLAHIYNGLWGLLSQLKSHRLEAWIFNIIFQGNRTVRSSARSILFLSLSEAVLNCQQSNKQDGLLKSTQDHQPHIESTRRQTFTMELQAFYCQMSLHWTLNTWCVLWKAMSRRSWCHSFLWGLSSRQFFHTSWTWHNPGMSDATSQLNRDRGSSYPHTQPT